MVRAIRRTSETVAVGGTVTVGGTSEDGNGRDGAGGEPGEALLPEFLVRAPMAAAVLAVDGRLLDANPSFTRLVGRDRNEIRGLHAREALGDAWARIEAGARWVALTNEPVAELEVAVRTRLAPHEPRRWLIGLFPASARDDRSIGLTVVDITTRERAKDEIRVLARASTLITAADDYDDALERAARVAVPEFADACVVHGPGDAFGETALAAELAGACSVISSPLEVGGRRHGAISFVYSRSGRRYRPEDVELASEIGRRIALALDNIQLGVAASRAHARLDLLARVGELLAVELDVQQRLRDIALMMLPDLGDAAGVYLVDGDELRLVAVGHADPQLDAAIARSPLPSHPTRAELVPCDALRAREPVLVNDVPPDVANQLAGRPATRPGASIHSLLCVPLVTNDVAIGVVALAWHRAERQHDVADVRLAQEIARRIAPAVEHARRYERDREIIEVLQRSLLPAALPDVPGVTIEGRYVPGTEGLRIGGDWYDALVMPGGQLFLAIGDVVGHGVRAASAMGRMRIALQIYALEGLEPAAMLGRLNRHFAGIAEADMATLALLLLDPGSGAAQLACAGHPPPVLRAPGGSVEFLAARSGPPVCALRHATYVQHELQLDLGTTVVLYTDGLVERRGEPLDLGLARLAATLAAGPHEVSALADTILAADTEGHDDVALLVVRIERDVAPFAMRVAAHPGELGRVRRSLTQWLVRVGTTLEQRNDLVLAVNEAVANAVGHAYGPHDADIVVEAARTDSAVEVSVRDFGSWREPRDVGGGRGLALIERLMDTTRVTTSPGGTEVRMRRAIRDAKGVTA